MLRMEWMPRSWALAAAALALTTTGCKSLNEKYIQLEVWKYERCFGHLPPGFVPPSAMAAAVAAPVAQPRPCGQPAACQQAAPCAGGGEAMVAGGMMGGETCSQCQSGGMEGGMPAGGHIVPGGPGLPGGAAAPMLPSGPGGSPGAMSSGAGMPTPAGVTSSRPVVISDEVVLP